MTHLIAFAATSTPTPVPGYDENQVTPGVIGFVVTAVLVLVIVLLLLDMVRRVRRVRYREESRERIAEELALQADAAPEPFDAPGTDAASAPESDPNR